MAAALCGDLFRIELAGADQPRPAGDDVQRRAQFMGDARGQAADGLQAVGVAKLLQGGDPRGGFLAQLALRFGQLRAHGVEALGQFRQFVAGAKVNGAFQVAVADPPGLGNQLLQRPPHKPNPSRTASSPLIKTMPPIKQRRAADDLPLVGFQFGHGKGEFQPALALGGQRHRPVDVQVGNAVGLIGLDGQVLLDDDRGQPLRETAGRNSASAMVSNHTQRMLNGCCCDGDDLAKRLLDVAIALDCARRRQAASR